MSLRSFKGLVSLAFLSLFFVSCGKEESVELNMPSMPTSGGTAVYALSVSSGTCMNADVQGTYKKSVATTGTNKVNIEVSVNTIGTWTVSSATITGFYFSGSGSFTAPGTQNITLNAHGTPNTAGIQTFTLIVGGTSCTFEVDVDSTGTGGGNPPPVSTDYFPVTQGSWWTYDDGAGDTSKTVVNGTSNFISKTYQNFINSYSYTTDKDTSYFRKDAATGFYYMYQDLTDLLAGTGVTMSQPQLEVLFTKNAMNTNDTWNNDFSGSFNTMPVTVRIKLTCISSTATVTANGNNFTNVYHVQMKVQYGIANIFQDVPNIDPQDLYFAKGVGLVKSEDPSFLSTIRYWHVN